MSFASDEQIITVGERRDLFNRERFWERAQRGELIAVVLQESHPAPPRAPEPFCTRSQIVDYWTHEGEKVAKVHQYLRPDGSIGASGRPDPKYVVIEGIRYRARSN